MNLSVRKWIVAAAAVTAAMTATSSASADVRAGIEAWRAGNYEAAVREWRPLAEAGEPDAQFNMGQAYKLGRGVPLDVTQAQTWYERAARQGHAQAEANLGLILFQNNERERAMPWIRRSAERGDPRAQYVLGTAHFNGDLAQQDWPRAYALMRRAADQGLPQARTSLTEMDRHLSAEDRQRGIALAQQMATSSAHAGVAPGAPSIQPVIPPVPMRTPRLAANEPPIVRTPVPAPRAAPPRVQPRAEPRAEARPEPRPPVATPRAAPAPVQAAASGRWRVQLGAFSNQGNAERQWRAVRTRVSGLSGLQPFLVRAGAITRLQAGPLASRAAADRLCAAARSSGTDCLVVAP
jgi:cell division septation protein DedD